MDIRLTAVPAASLVFYFLYGLIACYDTTGRMIEYVYYPYTLGWNEARNVCHSIGGDLAKVDSDGTFNAIINARKIHYQQTGNYFQFVEFWLGLYYATPSEQRFTLDCSDKDVTSPDVNYDSRNQCFKVYVDWNRYKYTISSASCLRFLPFLCEIHAGGTCSFETNVNEWRVSSVNCVNDYNACENLCAYDRTCMGVLFVSPSTCYTLPFSASNVTTRAIATQSSKVCGASFINNATQFTPDPYFQDVNEPMVDCGVIPILGPPDSSELNISTACPPPATTTAVTKTTFTMELTETLSADTVTVKHSYMTTTEVIVTTVSASIETTASAQVQMTTICAAMTETTASTLTPTPTVTVTSYVCTASPETTTATLVATPSCSLPTVPITPSVTTQASPESITSSSIISFEAERIAAEISKNLTVDAKETSSYKRSLICARDGRTTSLAIGTVGMACIAVPLAVIMSTDIMRALRIVKKMMS